MVDWASVKKSLKNHKNSEGLYPPYILRERLLTPKQVLKI